MVSVVIPTFRRPRFLGRAIESVLAQTHERWELIVVDDNGEGNDRHETAQLMSRFAGDARVRYEKHASNRGGAAARNTGIACAKGEFVAFLDDDDEWLPEKLERQLARFAEADERTALVYTGFTRVDDATAARRDDIPPGNGGDLFVQLLKDNAIGTTSTVLCRRDALQEIGGFDESLPAKQDIDLYVRLAERYPVAAVREPLAIYHEHAQSSIGKNLPGLVEAHRAFYEKHRDAIARHPKVHHYRLKWDGKVFLRAGLKREAREKFVEALRVMPTDFELIGLIALTYTGGGNQILALRRWLSGLQQRQ